MKKTFNFGKIDWYGTGRKVNEVTVEVELRDTDKGPVFSASGNVWNSKKTDIVAGGQILDSRKLSHLGPKFRQIKDLWLMYHLNDMHAGTPEQEVCLKDFEDERAQIAATLNEPLHCYEVDKWLLRNHNLETVNLNGKPYTYGTAWLYRPIQEDDLAEIKELLK